MHRKEWISLSIIIGFVVYFLLVCAYKKGWKDYEKQDHSKQAIHHWRIATGRYCGLYIQSEQQNKIKDDTIKARNEMTLQYIILLNKCRNGK